MVKFKSGRTSQARRKVHAVLPKTEREEIRVSICDFGNSQGIDVRVWFLPMDEGRDWSPSKKGIFLPFGVAGDVAAAVSAAIESCDGGETMPEDMEEY